MKEKLYAQDIDLLQDLRSKHLGIDNLRNIFSRINSNPRIKSEEKTQLKQILISNINKAWEKKYHK